MGFVFVSNTGRAGLPSRAAFYLEPGCLHQERPEECLEKLSFSLPVPMNKTVQKTTRAQPIESDGHETRSTARNGYGFRDTERDARVRVVVVVVVVGCDHFQTGGPGKREEEAESREKMGRKRGQR